MQASGGFIISRQPLVRSGVNKHTSALEQPISQFDLDSLNHVQETSWAINRRVFEVADSFLTDVQLARTAGAHGGPRDLAGFRSAVVTALPERMEDEAWAALAPEAKKAYLAGIARIHSTNASATGREQALLDTMSVARVLLDLPELYFPHSRCFRGRIHPCVTSGPNPQGSDLQKGLLQFAEGVPLGPDGLYWLCIRAANCAGQDKLALEDRVGWVFDNLDLIHQTALDPLGNRWWAKEDVHGDAEVDEPWSLLATIFELSEAMGMEDPEGYVSYLPVPLDGSCNGIQHLAAMGLDPVGSRATNLCANTPRQDIYAEVANAVSVMVEKDAAAGKEAALAWRGKIGRKTVKRAVMTTPYGVTDGGIRGQLLNDGLVPKDAGIGQGAAADYLRDCLVTALGQTVKSARDIMSWLQKTADSLARAGIPFDWETPTGSQVRQAYYTTTFSRVRTLVGSLKLETEMPEGALNPRKQALASAPNFIHSQDASHLSATVNLCSDRGITSFALIHDSYGVHAGKTTILARALRETFVIMYQTDWLKKLSDRLTLEFPHVELPPLPDRGTFDVSQVMDAPFFFS